MSKIKVYLATPTTGTVVDSQEYALRDIKELYKDHIEFIYPTQCVRRIFHDFARNMAVDDFLSSGADILWFLDSDITPSKYILDLITMHKDKWEVAGAVYPVFMTPEGCDGPEVVYTAYKWNEERKSYIPSPVPREGLDFVDALATGCLFIKRSVFEKLEQPYFEFKFDPKTRNMVEGEDLGFCRKLNKAGIKFFTDYAILGRHQKVVDLLDVNNYAIKFANRSIEQYSQNTKAQVEQAVKEAYQIGYKKGLEAKPEAKSIPKPSTLWLPNN